MINYTGYVAMINTNGLVLLPRFIELGGRRRTLYQRSFSFIFRQLPPSKSSNFEFIRIIFAFFSHWKGGKKDLTINDLSGNLRVIKIHKVCLIFECFFKRYNVYVFFIIQNPARCESDSIQRIPYQHVTLKVLKES